MWQNLSSAAVVIGALRVNTKRGGRVAFERSLCRQTYADVTFIELENKPLLTQTVGRCYQYFMQAEEYLSF